VVKEREKGKTQFKEAVERGETAGLLEQSTPDVFSTNLGNIPAGGTVRVEIEYIMELKHDAEVDGLRFTIPTSIAPRYGVAPSGVGAYHETAGTKGGNRMKISVQVTMPSHVRSISSSSHTISAHLGSHIEDAPDDIFDPKRALAKLSQTSTELDKDFVLIVKCSDLSSPRALLEVHPTIPDSKALMVTLVPKFTLPPGPKPEIVFVVDRSGSMMHRMEPLKSSLGVFLKSLPLGVKFNICSFGSTYSFLWNTSQSYSAESLEQAQRHVASMEANCGGTEILQPVKAAVTMRHADLSLEIMVLTDGEVWHPDGLYRYIEEATADGDVRLFTLGIGQDVSHALVEGMARVGRGFAQIVSDEKEGMEGKVVRMLRGGLSAHIKDYRLEWEGKPSDEELAQQSTSSEQTAAPKAKKISLFDMNADTEPPISFSALPDFIVPTVLQAPYKIPPLFPFSRSTAYVILSSQVPAPSSVWLRGTTPTGDELELEINVQHVKDNGETIHQLAGRKILQELEEGTGYLHSGKYGVDKKVNSGTFEEWVKREGVRVGIKYGLASKWTSFLAVTKKEDMEDKEGKERSVDEESAAEEEDNEFEFVAADEVMVDSQPMMQYNAAAPTGAVPQQQPFLYHITGGGSPSPKKSSYQSFGAPTTGSFGSSGSPQAQMRPPAPQESSLAPQSTASAFSAPHGQPFDTIAKSMDFGRFGSSTSAQQSSPASQPTSAFAAPPGQLFGAAQPTGFGTYCSSQAKESFTAPRPTASAFSSGQLYCSSKSTGFGSIGSAPAPVSPSNPPAFSFSSSQSRPPPGFGGGPGFGAAPASQMLSQEEYPRMQIQQQQSGGLPLERERQLFVSQFLSLIG
jgi:hypothetical protein